VQRVSSANTRMTCPWRGRVQRSTSIMMQGRVRMVSLGCNLTLWLAKTLQGSFTYSHAVCSKEVRTAVCHWTFHRRLKVIATAPVPSTIRRYSVSLNIRCFPYLLHDVLAESKMTSPRLLNHTYQKVLARRRRAAKRKLWCAMNAFI
jgi:hypothetical protein